MAKETMKCHLSFIQKAHFQNFVHTIKSMNLQTYEPVNFNMFNPLAVLNAFEKLDVTARNNVID